MTGVILPHLRSHGAGSALRRSGTAAFSAFVCAAVIALVRAMPSAPASPVPSACEQTRHETIGRLADQLLAAKAASRSASIDTSMIERVLAMDCGSKS
jgi:hypothetical protein